MKPSTSTPHVLIAALATLTLAVSTEVSSAGSGGDVRNLEEAPTVLTGAPSAKQKAAATSPITLFIETATGDTVRLIYKQDAGWRLRNDAGDATSPGPAVVPTATRQATANDRPVNDPLTVFIDGPTGFTYVWIRDVGWKFVGRIAGARP